ncbi:hypothetical protein DFH09DRAFT_1394344 [Mycena vulgaris]|nr:hypothetical protein DFH09DRAFT_1394344 [Mycena vulgaris]
MCSGKSGRIKLRLAGFISSYNRHGSGLKPATAFAAVLKKRGIAQYHHAESSPRDQAGGPDPTYRRRRQVSWTGRDLEHAAGRKLEHAAGRDQCINSIVSRGACQHCVETYPAEDDYVCKLLGFIHASAPNRSGGVVISSRLQGNCVKVKILTVFCRSVILMTEPLSFSHLARSGTPAKDLDRLRVSDQNGGLSQQQGVCERDASGRKKGRRLDDGSGTRGCQFQYAVALPGLRERGDEAREHQA